MPSTSAAALLRVRDYSSLRGVAKSAMTKGIIPKNRSILTYLCRHLDCIAKEQHISNRQKRTGPIFVLQNNRDLPAPEPDILNTEYRIHEFSLLYRRNWYTQAAHSSKTGVPESQQPAGMDITSRTSAYAPVICCTGGGAREVSCSGVSNVEVLPPAPQQEPLGGLPGRSLLPRRVGSCPQPPCRTAGPSDA